MGDRNEGRKEDGRKEEGRKEDKLKKKWNIQENQVTRTRR